MSWLEKLEKIVHIDLRHFITINYIKNELSKDKIKISEDGKKIEINAAALDKDELVETKRFFRKQFDKNDVTFLEKSAKAMIDDIKEKLNLKTTKVILNFYEDKIPKEYLAALEASLILREAFKDGKDVSEMKRDIISSFGPIGKNTSNLCSSDYFEGFIRELYFEMSRQPNFTLDKFQKVFKEIIIDSPFTVFVNLHRRRSDIKMEINSKLKKFQNYGIDYLAVHGIGTENVKMIREAISELENERDDIKTEMKLESSIIQVKIMFR